MVFRKMGALLGFLAGAAVFVFGQTETKTALTLEECILRTVKNNMGVAVSVLDPDVFALGVSQAREKFIPTLQLSFQHQKNNEPNFSWIKGGDEVSSTQSYLSAYLYQYLPTGGNLSFYLTTLGNDTTARFQTINPYYYSTLSFEISQPLLRDFGPTISRKEILVARNNSLISENTFTSTLLDVVYQTEYAYWNLYYAIESLKVQRQSLVQAEELLEKNRKEIAIGTRAPQDILKPEAEVARRKTDLLSSESVVREAEDALKKLINIEDKENSEIIPVDSPSFEKRTVSLDDALAQARIHRPDLATSKILIENAALNLTYARNQLLPGLSLTARYAGNGISGTRILYQDPYSDIIIGKIPGKAIDSLKQASDFKYRNWSVFLTLDIPFKTIFSRAAAAQAAIERDQAVLSLKKAEQDALYEIKSAIRAIEIDAQRVESSRVSSDFARRQLEAEEAKFKAGLSDNFYLLTYQQALTDARIVELKAIIDYNLSLFKLDKATGASLKNRNIRVE